MDLLKETAKEMLVALRQINKQDLQKELINKKSKEKQKLFNEAVVTFAVITILFIIMSIMRSGHWPPYDFILFGAAISLVCTLILYFKNKKFDNKHFNEDFQLLASLIDNGEISQGTIAEIKKSDFEVRTWCCSGAVSEYKVS